MEFKLNFQNTEYSLAYGYFNLSLINMYKKKEYNTLLNMILNSNGKKKLNSKSKNYNEYLNNYINNDNAIKFKLVISYDKDFNIFNKSSSCKNLKDLFNKQLNIEKSISSINPTLKVYNNKSSKNVQIKNTFNNIEYLNIKNNNTQLKSAKIVEKKYFLDNKIDGNVKTKCNNIENSDTNSINYYTYFSKIINDYLEILNLQAFNSIDSIIESLNIINKNNSNSENNTSKFTNMEVILISQKETKSYIKSIIKILISYTLIEKKLIEYIDYLNKSNKFINNSLKLVSCTNEKLKIKVNRLKIKEKFKEDNDFKINDINDDISYIFNSIAYFKDSFYKTDNYFNKNNCKFVMLHIKALLETVYDNIIKYKLVDNDYLQKTSNSDDLVLKYINDKYNIFKDFNLDKYCKNNITISNSNSYSTDNSLQYKIINKELVSKEFNFYRTDQSINAKKDNVSKFNKLDDSSSKS